MIQNQHVPSLPKPNPIIKIFLFILNEKVFFYLGLFCKTYFTRIYEVYCLGLYFQGKDLFGAKISDFISGNIFLRTFLVVTEKIMVLKNYYFTFTNSNRVLNIYCSPLSNSLTKLN